MKRVAVTVETARDSNGWPIPLIMIEDGTRYLIDRVLYYSKALEGEYEGVRYTVNICGREVYLYRDRDSWYLLLPDSSGIGGR